jgi:hypothetical protein
MPLFGKTPRLVRVYEQRDYASTIWMQIILIALPVSIFATMIVSSALRTKIAFCMYTSLGRPVLASRP